jgi:hypothetical protein
MDIEAPDSARQDAKDCRTNGEDEIGRVKNETTFCPAALANEKADKLQKTDLLTAAVVGETRDSWVRLDIDVKDVVTQFMKFSRERRAEISLRSTAS